MYLINLFLFLLVSLIRAAPQRHYPSNIHKRSTPCSGNTADNRTIWCDYDISTDYYETVPDTGVIREYWLNLEETTLAPDGISRLTLTVNGTIPGPTLIADWGDTIIVHVTNSLTESKNGSSIHFHGIRQNFTNQNDGVVSVTQCPSAPGETYTYTWRATQYGSSWYHSHFALQAWEGIFGGIIINGPASSNYDEDLGNLFIQDWSHQTVDELYDDALNNGVVQLNTGLINGTNVNGTGSDQVGQYFTTNFTAGQSYRLRIVNVAIDTHFKFMIDNHTLTVIASDFVPITPYTTDVLNVAMGKLFLSLLKH
jgi:FtsP/CotA-like multicopper oxidase with cupredoxin domain